MNRQTFVKWIFRKRQAYKAIFARDDGVPNRAAHIVLSDLRDFCRGTSTPAVMSPATRTIDPIATGIAIGRLEVWHRITQNINLSDADLYRLVDKPEQDQGDE